MGSTVLDWVFVFMPPVLLAYFAWEVWRDNKRRLEKEAAEEAEFETQVTNELVPWEAIEDHEIKAHWKVMDDGELAEMLGRTEKAVRLRRHYLGLYRGEK